MVELADGAERARALQNAGWKSGGTYTPSAADAWAHHKRAQSTGAGHTSKIAVGDLAKNVDAYFETFGDDSHADNPVHIAIDLPSAEALALAQFVKRVTWTEMRACAVDEAECYQIRAAIDRVQRALADADHSPR